MDKVFSTRIDERVIALVGNLAWRLHTSKKQIVERAVLAYSETMGLDGADVIRDTCGVWQRDEPAAETVGAARAAFRRPFEDRDADLR